MLKFEVRRKIDGYTFMRDEDRIFANNWKEAELLLLQKYLAGAFDDSCVLAGIIVHEEELSENKINKTKP